MHHGVIEDLERAPRTPAFIACDPRFVIVVFALIVAVSFVVRSTAGLVIILGYVLLLLRLARMSARLVIRRTRTVATFVVLAVVLNAFLVKGNPLPQPMGRRTRPSWYRR